MFTMILLLLFLAPQTQAQTAVPGSSKSTDQNSDPYPDGSPFAEDGVSGGGRLCNGYLRIYPHYLDWETTNYSCHHTSYETIKQSPHEYIYRLKPWSRKCDFRILIVRHPGEKGEGGWQAIGYSTEAAWHREDDARQMSCQGLF